MKLSVDNITPTIMVKNEVYWIHYVLRDLLRTFPKVIMLDTGSTDETKYQARRTEEFVSGGELILIEEDYGDDADLIGNGWNVLREVAVTHWVFLVAGDEIWPKAQLDTLIGYEMPEDAEIGMFTGRNVVHDGEKWQEREGFNADRLFDPGVYWDKIDYPFESHGLYDKVDTGVVHYLPIWYWHVRHLARSPDDDDTYFRSDKLDFFGPDLELKSIAQDWMGDIEFSNPYLMEAEA